MACPPYQQTHRQTASKNLKLGLTPWTIPKSARDRTFVSLSGRHASAQVGHSSQAQAPGDFPNALPACREEIAILRPDRCEVRDSPPRREERQEIPRSRSSIINHAIDAAHSLLLPFPSRSWRLRGDRINWLNRLRVRCPKTADPALGDFSKALPAGREEAAEKAALAQSGSNRTSTCRWLSITENPATAAERI